MRRITRAILDVFVPHERNSFRPYLLRTVGIVIAAILLGGAALGFMAYRATLVESDFLAAVLPGVLVSLANVDRSEHALSSLSVNPLLVQAAQAKANDMAAKGYFAHVSPDGVEPWHWFDVAGYSFVYAGENLAVNFDDSSEVNRAWMNSPTHRANILGDQYTEIGIAIAQGVYEGHMTTFIVEEFGSPAVKKSNGDVSRVSTLSRQEQSSSRPVSIVTAPTPHVEGAQIAPGSSSSFVAVRNENAVAASPSIGLASPSTSTFWEYILSSPSVMLDTFYGLIAGLLVVALIMIFLVSHPHRAHHVSRILFLGMLFGMFYVGMTYFGARFLGDII